MSMQVYYQNGEVQLQLFMQLHQVKLKLGLR